MEMHLYRRRGGGGVGNDLIMRENGREREGESETD